MAINLFGEDAAAVAEAHRLRDLRERFNSLDHDIARRLALIAAQREEMLARNGAAVADADPPRGDQGLVREGADANSEADPYEDELELESDSEEEEEDDDEERREKREEIRKLREENEQSSSLRFSRACTACDAAEPRRRVVFMRCGHTVCRECVDARLHYVCPTCLFPGPCVKLYEEAADDGQGFSRACSICVTDHPRARAYFTRCGHIVCLACALQLELDAEYAYDADVDDSDEDDGLIELCCPMCKTKGEFEELKERLETN